MSVILDALKKLDREKASRRSGTANIAAEILSPDRPRSGKRVSRYVTIAFLTAIATAAITYGVIVKSSFVPKSSPPPAVNPPASKEEVAPVPTPGKQARDTQDEISRVPPKIQTPVRSKELAPPSVENKGEEAKVKQNVIVKEPDIASEKASIPAEQASHGSPKTPPSLNISAIVWYEEPSKRFAMINGLIVTEGSVVEGMKVEEIYPDRVRFLHQNQHLEIFIK
jgi:general secretion pathway protein B